MWEGISQCLKWFNFNNLGHPSQLDMTNIIYSATPSSFLAGFSVCSAHLDINNKTNNLNSLNRKFYTNSKIPSTKRIGPHDIDIISILIGAILGDTHLEKRKTGKGTRIKFEQSSKNVEYLMWFHSYFSSRGYCSPESPKLTKRIKDTGVFFHYSMNSYTFSSLNWLHDMFYKEVISPISSEAILTGNQNPDSNKVSIKQYTENTTHNTDIFSTKYVKVIPTNLEEYLTPLSLAIWFSDDGSKFGKSAKFATNCFSLDELKFLCDILHSKFNIRTSIHSGGVNKGYVIYIWVESMPDFSKLVKSLMLPSLHYKLGDY